MHWHTPSPPPLVVETYTRLRDLAQSGQISHRIAVPAGPDLRIWPAEPDLTDLPGCPQGQMLCDGSPSS
jgi:hypothetical protein